MTPHDALEFIAHCKATDGSPVELWHWPDCERCGMSRYGGPVVTAWCGSCGMTDAPRLHAELSASTSERWMNCPGSVRLIRSTTAIVPPSSYALEGTAMHLGAAAWLSSGVEPDWPLAEFGGMTLDDDHIEAIKVYRQAILDDMALYGGELAVERKFSLESLRPNMWGTNDAMLLRCRDHVLRVYDFKGGVGVLVEVENNSQLLYYGYGAVLTAKAGPIKELELIIVQPRARHPDGPVRRWRVDLIDAYDFSQTLIERAEATDDPNAPLCAGEWCRFCPVAGVCKAYEDYATRQAGIDFGDDPFAAPATVPPKPGSGSGGAMAPLPDPALLTQPEIGALLPKLSILEDWIALVRHYAHAEAEAGRDIPGYKLVAKRGRRQWIGEAREVIPELHALGLLDHAIYNMDLKSPAQIEKLLPKEARGEIKRLAQMVSSGTVLAPDTDDRPPLAGTGLAVFTPLPEGQPLD